MNAYLIGLAIGGLSIVLSIGAAMICKMKDQAPTNYLGEIPEKEVGFTAQEKAKLLELFDILKRDRIPPPSEYVIFLAWLHAETEGWMKDESPLVRACAEIIQDKMKEIGL